MPKVYTIDDVGPKRVGDMDVDLTDSEKEAMVADWNAYEAERPIHEAGAEREDKIQQEIDRIAREQAVANLEERGEL